MLMFNVLWLLMISVNVENFIDVTFTSYNCTYVIYIYMNIDSFDYSSVSSYSKIVGCY